MVCDKMWGGVVLGLFLTGCLIPPAEDCTGTQGSEPERMAWVEGASGFTEEFDTHDTARWYISPSSPFLGSSSNQAAWCLGNVLFAGGAVHLAIGARGQSQGCHDKDTETYSAGELVTKNQYGFGRYEVRLKPARAPGTVTTLSIVQDPTQTLSEVISLEWPGGDTRRVWLAFGPYGKYRVGPIALPFDAASGFHTYALEWSREALDVYVDHQRVHSEMGATGTLPSTPGTIRLNFQPGVESSMDSLVGAFTYLGSPLVSSIQSFRYGPASPIDVLDDFEAPDSMNAWTSKSVAPGSFRIERVRSFFSPSGYALVMSYDVPSNSGEAVRSFSTPRDWRSARYLNFYVDNYWGDRSFQLELRDNGESPDTAERFVYDFSNTGIGVKWMSIPLRDFKRRTDWQPEGAPDDGLTLSSVWGFSIKPQRNGPNDGTLNIPCFDDFHLERAPVPPPVCEEGR